MGNWTIGAYSSAAGAINGTRREAPVSPDESVSAEYVKMSDSDSFQPPRPSYPSYRSDSFPERRSDTPMLFSRPVQPNSPWSQKPPADTPPTTGNAPSPPPDLLGL